MSLQKLAYRLDPSLLDYENYDNYLEAHERTEDKRYVSNKSARRKMVMLNYYPGREVYTENQFNAALAFIHEQLQIAKQRTSDFNTMFTSTDPVLVELAIRERANYQKTLSTIIFLSYRDKNGFEKSGFIDFDSSIRRFKANEEGATDWEKVYQEQIKLIPKPHDLSYYDIHNSIVRYNTSENYIVLHDVHDGLTFVHRGDHNKICVGKSKLSHRNFHRSVHYSNIHGYVVFYDHIVRKKN